MPNIVYNKFLELIAKNDLDWESDVIRVLLERSTSAYSPDVDHDFLDSFTGGGGVEISVASYARQTLANGAVNLDDTNDRAELDGDNIAFGALETGQTVNAIIVYQQVGGDDTTPANDPLIAYIDGKITVTLAADAASSATTIYVDPLDEALDSGTALDFGGGATCSLSSSAAAGARSLSVTALGAAGTAGDTSEATASGSLLPVALGGGNFNCNLDTEGLIQLIS